MTKKRMLAVLCGMAVAAAIIGVVARQGNDAISETAGSGRPDLTGAPLDGSGDAVRPGGSANGSVSNAPGGTIDGGTAPVRPGAEGPAAATPGIGGSATAPVSTRMSVCTVVASGDKEAVWQGTEQGMVTSLEPWLTAAERKKAVGFSFVVGCIGRNGDSVTFFAADDATASDIPYAPKTYDLSAEAGGPVKAFVVLASSDTSWLPASGSLSVTTFNEKEIAGSFTMDLVDALETMNGSSEGKVVLKGSFEFLRGK